MLTYARSAQKISLRIGEQLSCAITQYEVDLLYQPFHMPLCFFSDSRLALSTRRLIQPTSMTHKMNLRQSICTLIFT